MDPQFIGSSLQFETVMYGHAGFQTMVAACHLDLFNYLHHNPGKTAQEISFDLKLPANSTRILLRACCAFGLIVKETAKYRNSELASACLVKDNPNNYIPFIEWLHYLVYPAMFFLDRSVKEGKNVGLEVFPGPGNTIYERLTASPHLERIFHDAMSTISRNSNHLLAQMAEFKEVTHVLDVGGGDATNAMRLCAAFPHLKVTIFDLPSVCESAAERIKQQGLSERIFTRAGNFFQDPFPEGIDGILFSHIFNIYSAEKNLDLLKKSHAALPAGGMVFIFDSIMSDDESGGSIGGASITLYFLSLASGEGTINTFKDYRMWFKEAGFLQIIMKELPLNHALVVGIK